jgi:hypothetical protein
MKALRPIGICFLLCMLGYLTSSLLVFSREPLLHPQLARSVTGSTILTSRLALGKLTCRAASIH